MKSSAIDGAFWNVFFAIANKVITAVGQFALAWFLTPRDMGLANTAQAMAAFTAILSVNGLGDVLLQRRKFKEEAGQALWLSILFSASTALIICAMALASGWLGKPETRNLLWFLALTIFVGAPITVMSASLKNSLDYKSLAASQFAAGLFFTPATVLLAWLGWGPYALILPLAPRQVVTMLFMWAKGGVFQPAKPALKKLVELAKPTLALSISSLFAGLQTQAPIFVCGMVLGLEKTGFFSWAWLVAGQVVFLLATNLRGVLLPTFTQVNDDGERVTAIALKAAHAMTAVLCVACGTQALLANALIGVFLPPKWHPAIIPVIFFSLGLVSQGLWVSGEAWLNAQGKYRLLVTMSALQVALNTGLTLLGALWGNVPWAVIGCSFATFAGGVVYFALMHRNSPDDRGHFWAKPVSGTLLLWVAFFAASWKRPVYFQMISACLFMGMDGWIWWLSDKGGLRLMVDKMPWKFWKVE